MWPGRCPPSRARRRRRRDRRPRAIARGGSSFRTPAAQQARRVSAPTRTARPCSAFARECCAERAHARTSTRRRPRRRRGYLLSRSAAVDVAVTAIRPWSRCGTLRRLPPCADLSLYGTPPASLRKARVTIRPARNFRSCLRPGCLHPKAKLQVLGPARDETEFAAKTTACPPVDGGSKLTWVKTIGG